MAQLLVEATVTFYLGMPEDTDDRAAVVNTFLERLPDGHVRRIVERIDGAQVLRLDCKRPARPLTISLAGPDQPGRAAGQAQRPEQ